MLEAFARNIFHYFSLSDIWEFIITYGFFHICLYLLAFSLDRIIFGPFEQMVESKVSLKHDILTLLIELINGRKLLGNVVMLGGVLYSSQHLPSLRLDQYFEGQSALLLLIYLIIYDFLLYWYHRLSHLQPLWVQHEYHHSATALNPLSDIRIHALSFPFLFIMVLIPIRLLFRVPPEMIVIFFFSLDVLSCLAHSRWNTTYGWFGKYVLVSPLYHRTHHSKSKLQHSNFGTYFAFWDHLFGTYTNPSNAHNLKTGVFNNPFSDPNENIVWSYFKVYPRFIRTALSILTKKTNSKIDPQSNDQRLA